MNSLGKLERKVITADSLTPEVPMKNKHLGMIATDKITGFMGNVTAYTQFLSGEDRYLITPPVHQSNEYPQEKWIPASRLAFGDPVLEEKR